MKKMFILTAASMFAVTVGLQAQTTTRTSNPVRFGLRAGINLSDLVKSSNSDITSGSKTGYNAAALVNIPIASVFSIQPEIQFSQKGYKESGTALGAPYEYKRTTNFIEVPLLAKITPLPGFGIVLGPQFSFLASTKTKFTVANATHENIVKEDNDNLRKNILGGVIGIEAGVKNFVASLRYNIDFQNNNGDGTNNTPYYKNRVISLGVAVMF